MMLIQFISQFPPYRGGLWEIAKEISVRAAKSDIQVINCISSAEQDKKGIADADRILFQNQYIGYRKDGYKVLIIPSFDIIYNFPCPKFRTREFFLIMSYLSSCIGKEKPVVQTHTRFFLWSLRGGLYAKWKWYKRYHVEHGSDYAKLNTRWKTWIARIRDEMLGRWILNTAHGVAISARVQQFVSKFTKHKTELIHNGIDFVPYSKINNDSIIKIGFVGRLVKLKGVHHLLQVFALLSKYHSNIVLEVVWWWDEEDNLKQLASQLDLVDVVFFGSKDRQRIAKEFLPHIDIFVNPSYMEWFPTSVLEALLSECIVVATDVGGTAEITDKNDLILIKPGDEKDLMRGLEKAISDYSSLSWLSKEYILTNFSRKGQIEKYKEYRMSF